MRKTSFAADSKRSDDHLALPLKNSDIKDLVMAAHLGLDLSANETTKINCVNNNNDQLR